MARFFFRYRTYNWRTKNPVIDKMRTVLQDEGMFAKKQRRLLHELSGVAVGTFDGWFEGDTKSPRHETVMAVMTAVGYEEQFVKTQTIDREAELEKAAAWREKMKAEKEAWRKEQVAAARSKPNGKQRPRPKIKT